MKTYKFIKLFMVLASSAIIMTGCGGNDNPGTDPEQKEDKIMVTDDSTLKAGELISEHKSTNGQHDYVVKAGNLFIEDYKIIVSNDKTYAETLKETATEIKDFIFDSTGYVLDIVDDSQYDETKHYISIGHTKAYSASTLDFSKEKELGKSGTMIKSDSKNVYLLGGEPFGISHVAYEFLKHEIALEIYGNNEYFYVNKTKLRVHDMDIFEIPDISLRICGNGTVQKNTMLRRRMRFNTGDEGGNIWMGPNDVPYHNTFDYLPPSQYKNTHPKWYSDDGYQLCFTAHGDEAEAKLMFDTFMAKFIDVVDSHPNCTTISITQQDISVWCKCDACSELRTHYGTDAASVVIFCNKVSDALKAHFEEKGINREVDILFFAYHKTTEAPAKKNEKGEWVPIDEQVVCRDNVCCFYAPILADYKESFRAQVNANFNIIMEQWMACSKRLYLWIYGTDFANYIAPMNNFNAIGDNYKYAYEHGAIYIYDQLQWNQTSPTGWNMLKNYLQSKLEWDTSLNFNDLVDNWFKNWFKDAYQPMKQLFDEWNSFTTNLNLTEGIGLGCFDGDITADKFPKNQIDRYLELINKAYEALEELKVTDNRLYSTVHDRILLESISYRYLDYKLYKSYYSNNQRGEIFEQLKSDINYLGISNLNEVTYITEFFGGEY